MSKADPKRTYEAAVFTGNAGMRPKRQARGDDADLSSAGDEPAAARSLRRKSQPVTPEIILRLIELLKDL